MDDSEIKDLLAIRQQVTIEGIISPITFANLLIANGKMDILFAAIRSGIDEASIAKSLSMKKDFIIRVLTCNEKNSHDYLDAKLFANAIDSAEKMGKFNNRTELDPFEANASKHHKSVIDLARSRQKDTPQEPPKIYQTFIYNDKAPPPLPHEEAKLINDYTKAKEF